MPVYDYKCKQHGLFHELAKMADSDKPQPCPECHALSARIIMLPPNFRQISKERLLANETNERSSHEPITSTLDQRKLDKQHQTSCGCGTEKKQRQVIYTADGGKVFPSARPWMISH